MAMTEVRVVSMDISDGQASYVHRDRNKLKWIYRMGVQIAEFWDPEYVNRMPQMFHHGAVLIGSTLYEFTDEGIHLTKGNSPADVLLIAAENEEVYITMAKSKVSESSIEKFERWLTSNSTKEKYNKNTYDNVFHNCLHFLIDVCSILEIEYPQEFTKFNEWLREHPNIIKLVGQGAGSNSTE